MSVTPFPIKRCLSHIDAMRCYIEAEPTAGRRKALLRQFIEQHRAFLASVGVEPGLIAREVHDLTNAVSPSPSSHGGMRMAA